MRNQMLNFVCLSLLVFIQICEIPFAKSQAETEPCTAPNGARGYCLIYTECANLTQWRDQNNLSNSKDVEKMFCRTDQIHVCCNHTNPYFTDPDHLSHLNPQGLAILNSMPCVRARSDRVANGENAILGEYPFMALLRYNVPKRPFLCGGSLITTRFVLTAAHCIRSDLIGVRLGEHNLSTEIDCVGDTLCLPPAEDYVIEQKIKHPNYNKPRWTHDVALLKLDREVEFKVHIKPICLPITPLVYEYSNLPTYYTIAGWGHTENTSNTEVLQHAKVPHQERSICQSIFGPRGVGITYDHICAGGERKIDTCKGDSGGPLFAAAPFKKINGVTLKRIVQYGIVSFGLMGCGGENTKSAAYANLLQYMPWIVENIA
ncbi:serine protease grass-like isoform X3 [Eurosta solidaginis]|uniref:serine protease grass-like isoform X2 n=1 Tax=Eurosta solidaginis TaxID=178769 RepID=UPI0035306EAB